MSKPLIDARNLTKKFGAQTIFENLNFTIKQGEILAIIGHSGCGKTTLLRVIGGFESADSGEVLVDGAKTIRPSKAAIMIFQDFTQLLAWRTVIGNIVWPMLVTKTVATKAEALGIAKGHLSDMGLTEAHHAKFPAQLSGGMKQRVAVARALALKPKLLLMDEPFGALDSFTRKKMQAITKQVCEKNGLAAALVTHSVKEAVTMSDKILVFCPDGRLEMFENNSKSNQKIKRFLGISSI
jgi:ABC-type nitrate/sulfonate/bicarbonate transport system ATPase subunit